ncbi:MAG TPA: helix-turn-helix transcriptional regulator [Mycobacteriales bacterium]|nr:helix-turn-helix transcriptional regulator [Mycobacteriales bacterium]
MFDEYASTPAGLQELAAAELAITVSGVLKKTFAASGMTASAVADELGVSESAVSQVLNGDGNLRIATIGRYTRAMGYQSCLAVHPVEPGRAHVECCWQRRELSREPIIWHMVYPASGQPLVVESSVVGMTPGRLVVESVFQPANDADVSAAFEVGGAAVERPVGLFTAEAINSPMWEVVRGA